MPTGPSHWHQHWKSDGRAVDYLRSRGFVFRKGVICGGPTVDTLDMAAIAYLINEWDYDWEGRSEDNLNKTLSTLRGRSWTKDQAAQLRELVNQGELP